MPFPLEARGYRRIRTRHWRPPRTDVRFCPRRCTDRTPGTRADRPRPDNQLPGCTVSVHLRITTRFRFLQIGAPGEDWSSAPRTRGRKRWEPETTGITNTRAVNYGLLTLDRSQGLTFNYIYDLPSLARKNSFLDNSIG